MPTFRPSVSTVSSEWVLLALFGFAALAGLNPFLAIPLAGFAAFVVAVPAMLIVFRLRTAYLSIGTWVVAEVLMLAAGKIEAFGGGSGESSPDRHPARVRDDAFSAAFNDLLARVGAGPSASFAATYSLLRSRIGLGLTAMRDNEESAGSLGVNIIRLRVMCFLGTAPFGAAGALITLQKLRIAPSASFSIADWTVLIIFNVIIGGIGSIEGPIIGTIVFFALRAFLTDYGTWYLMLLGALSIAIILVDRRGLWGLGPALPAARRS